MKFEEIQYQWTLDCEMDETELSRESIKIPQLHNKYLIFYSNEKLKFKEIKYLFAGLVRRKRDYYSGRMTVDELEAADWEPFQLKLLKADVQEYIDADDNVIESKKLLALQEEKVNYLESIVKSLTTRGYLIKNAIDWKRFTEGH
jgi:hypothetical protein